jgi:hypothetical protein
MISVLDRCGWEWWDVRALTSQWRLGDNRWMGISKSLYKHHRFPPEIIQHAVWLYYRFNLSGRDIEDLLAERGIAVSYESIRLWCIKFGTEFAKRLRRRHQGYGDTLPGKVIASVFEPRRA